MSYNLEFISDEDLYNHVKDTVDKYRFGVSYKEFTKNIIDPIKLTFDSKVYGKTIEETIEDEIRRQIDKSNSNNIGYFHQNIFKFIGGNKWTVPKKGFDIINEEAKVYVEMKNKHNTMNSSSGQKTFIKLQNKVLNEQGSRCFLVEVIAKKTQDIVWSVTVDGEGMGSECVRRVSIDKFYEFVTGDEFAFKRLCEVLPIVLDDIVEEIELEECLEGIVTEYHKISPNLLKSIYMNSFKNYEGFDDFNI